jgi:hypothetical protein
VSSTQYLRGCNFKHSCVRDSLKAAQSSVCSNLSTHSLSMVIQKLSSAWGTVLVQGQLTAQSKVTPQHGVQANSSRDTRLHAMLEFHHYLSLPTPCERSTATSQHYTTVDHIGFSINAAQHDSCVLPVKSTCLPVYCGRSPLPTVLVHVWAAVEPGERAAAAGDGDPGYLIACGHTYAFVPCRCKCLTVRASSNEVRHGMKSWQQRATFLAVCSQTSCSWLY